MSLLAEELPAATRETNTEAHEAELLEIVRAQTCPDTSEGLQLRQQGLTELYMRHHDRIFSYALSLTKNYQDAENLVQEVFLSMTRSIDRFTESGAGIYPWLYKIARNAHVNELRRWSSKHEVLHADDDHALAPDGVLSMAEPCFRAAIEEKSATENIALAHLDFADRLAVWSAGSVDHPSPPAVFMARIGRLFLYENGYAYQEIAEMEHVAVGTIMSGLNRVKKQIRETEAVTA